MLNFCRHENMIISKFGFADKVLKTVKGNFSLRLKQKLQRFPDVLKLHTVSIIKHSVQNCECLAAYKLRRGQQMFLFYKKLWGDAGFNTVIKQLRQRFLKQLAERCSRLMLSVYCLSRVNWDSIRIPENNLLPHLYDIDEAKGLICLTLICPNCKLRLVIDSKVRGINYCECEGIKSVVNHKSDQTRWLPFLERDKLLIWRTEHESNPGMYQYKVFGRYDDVRADIFLKVQVDTDYRKTWDPTAVDIRTIQSEHETNSDLIYWEMKWPTLFANRDYVFNRRFLVLPSENLIVIRNQIAEVDEVPQYKNKVRVKDYWCTMLIKPFTSFDQPGLEFCMTYFDDPGLAIPSAVQTWVATTAMPDFLAKMRTAAISFYLEYMKSPTTLSPWPDHFTLTVVSTGNEIKETYEEDNDYNLFKFFSEVFC